MNATPTAPKPNGLTELDLQNFARIGIPLDLLIEAGICRVTDREARQDYGMTGSGDLTGVIFPYRLLANGYRTTARLRRDFPNFEDGKAVDKYLSAPRDSRHLFFPPGAAELLRDPGQTVVLVEAEKSSLALTALGRRTGQRILAVAVGGCWGWRGRIGKEPDANGNRVDVKGPIYDLDQCNGRQVVILFDSNCATNEKVQIARLVLARELRQRGCQVLVVDLPQVERVNGPDDYIEVFGDEAMHTVLKSAHEFADMPVGYSDDELALRFTNLHVSNLRYTAAWGRWSVWEEGRWKADETLEVVNLVRSVCRQAASEVDQKQAARLASAATVSAVERLARSDRRHTAEVKQWDRDPWVLNTPGGVIDLKTGDLRAAAREDYCIRMSSVAPGGECPQWRGFLHRITNGDQALQDYLQRVCGYCLTGSTQEHALFFLFGTGANGKSVFINTIIGVMGDYKQNAPIETFTASRLDRHPTELAMLQGARLVTAVETEAGGRWNESKLKTLTGGDPISARFMRQDHFVFTPAFKLLIAGNHKPGLRTVDEAMRRRLHLVPFTVTIPLTERDSDLQEKLRAEYPGILKWMVEGCLAWQKDGLNPPAAVREATEEYFAEEDTLSRWLEECCTEDPTQFASFARLFSSWGSWCARYKVVEEISRAEFSQKLEARGFTKARTSRERLFYGIQVVNDVTDMTG